MKPGDIITIKNDCGLLNIRIEKALEFFDVMRGIGDDKLPAFSKPRLEYHEGDYPNSLVTICERTNKLPFNIYLLLIYPGEKPECYLGVCDCTEGDVYETKY